MTDVMREPGTRSPEQIGAHLQVVPSPSSDQKSEDVFLWEQETTLVGGYVFVDDQLIQYTAEFPAQAATSTINLILGGYGAFKRISRDLRHAMATRGHASVTTDTIRADKRSIRERLLRPQKAHVDTGEAVMRDIYSNDLFRQQVPNKEQYVYFDQMALVLHSMAGLSGTRLAAKHPDVFEGVVEVETVGKGSPTLWQLARSFPGQLPDTLEHELIPYILGEDGIDITPRNVGRFLHYYGRNPARTVGEALSCLRERNLDITAQLRKNGQYVVYLAGLYDFVVPETEHVAEHVDIYRVLPAGHMLPMRQANLAASEIIAAQQELRGRMLTA